MIPQPLVVDLLAEFHEWLGQLYGSGADRINLRRTLHEEEGRELLDALAGGDRMAIAQELADVVYVAYGTAHDLGIPLDAVIAEIHAANMRKLDRDLGAITRADGKISKPPGWQPPDVAAVLARHGALRTAS